MQCPPTMLMHCSSVLFLLSLLLPLEASSSSSSLVSSCHRAPNNTTRGHFSFLEWGASTRANVFQEYCQMPEKYKDVKEVDSTRQCRFHHMKFSQCGQDVTVASLLKNKKEGYFVDMAANHWCFFSNTLRLESVYGWKGVCIEANAAYLSGLVQNRTCDVVLNVASKADNDVVTFVEKGAMGGILAKGTDNAKSRRPTKKSSDSTKLITKSYTAVSLRTILNALDAPREIDYMSLDVEGAEALVLQGFDFKKYTVTVMTVERPSEAVHRILVGHGYWYIASVGGHMGEVLYLHETYPGIDETIVSYEKLRWTTWRVSRGKIEEHPYLLKPKRPILPQK